MHTSNAAWCAAASRHRATTSQAEHVLRFSGSRDSVHASACHDLPFHSLVVEKRRAHEKDGKSDAAPVDDCVLCATVPGAGGVDFFSVLWLSCTAAEDNNQKTCTGAAPQPAYRAGDWLRRCLQPRS